MLVLAAAAVAATAANGAADALFRQYGLPACSERWQGEGLVVVVGGQGGSGTRLQADLIFGPSGSKKPCHLWGRHSEDTRDSLGLRNSGLAALCGPLLDDVHSPYYDIEQLSPKIKETLVKGFHSFLCEELPEFPEEATCGGFKEPRNQYFIPFYRLFFGQRFRYIQGVRDVRKINNPHLEAEGWMIRALYGPAAFLRTANYYGVTPFVRSWARTQQDVLNYGIDKLVPSGSFLVLRYEDLTVTEGEKEDMNAVTNVLMRLCQFIGVPSNRAVQMYTMLVNLRRPQSGKLGKFPCCGKLRIAEQTLRDYGYAVPDAVFPPVKEDSAGVVVHSRLDGGDHTGALGTGAYVVEHGRLSVVKNAKYDLIVVTPTTPRGVQYERLCRLGQSLARDGRILWLLSDDTFVGDPEVLGMLEALSIPFVYLYGDYKAHFGHVQRRLALEFIRWQRLSGTVYMADDDNAFSPQLWDVLRRKRKGVIGLMPIGIPTWERREGPVFDDSGRLIDWEGQWNNRTFPVDMGAISYDAEELWNLTPPLWVHEGFAGEKEFLQRLLPAKDFLNHKPDIPMFSKPQGEYRLTDRWQCLPDAKCGNEFFPLMVHNAYQDARAKHTLAPVCVLRKDVISDENPCVCKPDPVSKRMSCHCRTVQHNDPDGEVWWGGLHQKRLYLRKLAGFRKPKRPHTVRR